MMKQFPGRMRVTQDLMWAAGVPLFLTGRLASLSLGPAAPNIGAPRWSPGPLSISLGPRTRARRPTMAMAPTTTAKRPFYLSGQATCLLPWRDATQADWGEGGFM